MDQEEKTQLVQMRLRPKTIERIDKLSKNSGIVNRTQLVSTAIEVTEALSEYIRAGGKIYIEKKDGTKERLNINGI